MARNPHSRFLLTVFGGGPIDRMHRSKQGSGRVMPIAMVGLRRPG